MCVLPRGGALNLVFCFISPCISPRTLYPVKKKTSTNVWLHFFAINAGGDSLIGHQYFVDAFG